MIVSWFLSLIGAVVFALTGCFAKNGKKKYFLSMLGCIVLTVLLIPIIGMAELAGGANETPAATPTPEAITQAEIEAQATTATYKDLLRYPDEHSGDYIVLTVEISQVLDGGLLDNNTYYFGYTDDTGYGLYIDDRYCLLDKRIGDDTKLLKGDVILVYGRFTELKTFEAALTGAKSEIPCVEMLYVEIIAE